MRKAYSYIRWSSGQQKHGVSLQRQTEDPLVLEFIKNHKLTVVETMIDRGVSGFKGKNFSNEKALGKFVEQIRQGRIERGSVLILESMDRFGRDVITSMIKRFIEIVEAGVSIGVVSMDVIIDLDTMNNNPMVWNFVSGEIQRARAESKRKSTFSTNNVFNKIQAAKAGKLVYFGGLSPSWIKGIKNKAGERIVKMTADKDGVQWIVDDKKVKIVQRMYRLYLEGKASTGIAKQFNEENVRTLKGVGIWENTTVKRLLKSKSVMGNCSVNDFQSENYYPEIISKNDFYKVQARMEQNKSNRGGSPHGHVPNIFKGITKCTCGSGITVFSHIVKGKDYRYGQCSTAKLRGNCQNDARWDLFKFEMHILYVLLGKLPHELMDKPKTKNDIVLDDLNGELNKVNAEITDTIKLVGKVKLPQLEASLTALQKQQEALNNKINEHKNNMTIAEASPYAMEKLNGLLNSSKLNEVATGLIELEKNLSDTPTREKLRNLMPDIFKSLVLDFNNFTYTATFTNGKSDTDRWQDKNEKAIVKQNRKEIKAFLATQKN